MSRVRDGKAACSRENSETGEALYHTRHIPTQLLTLGLILFLQFEDESYFFFS